jgi:hypothetical protein
MDEATLEKLPEGFAKTRAFCRELVGRLSGLKL